MLVNAEYPVIIAERAARTEAGLKYMVELAELLQAAVVDTIQRMNFPSRHPLRQTPGVVSQADVILSLENPLLWSALNAPENEDFGAPASNPSRLQPGAKADHASAPSTSSATATTRTSGATRKWISRSAPMLKKRFPH